MSSVTKKQNHFGKKNFVDLTNPVRNIRQDKHDLQDKKTHKKISASIIIIIKMKNQYLLAIFVCLSGLLSGTAYLSFFWFNVPLYLYEKDFLKTSSKKRVITRSH